MATDTNGRALLDAIASASRQHRLRCLTPTFMGDRQACANVADAADAFVDGAGARLLAKSEGGDGESHRRLMEGGRRILDAVGGAFTEISKGVDVSDLVGDIGDTAKRAATSPWLKVAAGVTGAAAIGLALRKLLG